MENKIQNGFLMLADISGYTSYMATTELEHSQEIIAEVLKSIIKKLTPIFTLAEVEGDAVYVYASEKKLTRGETVLELIESVYSEFFKMKSLMQTRSECTCQACRSIHLLNLKFVNHYGSFMLQNMGGKLKPIGSDINLIHRLLKNSVAAKTGWRGYALFTELCLNKLGVALSDNYSHEEEYEHYGKVKLSVYNLEKQYAKLIDKECPFPSEKEWVHVQMDFDASPSEVWDWMNDPNKRSLWMEGTTWTASNRKGGRTGPGTVNHCHHGSGITEEKILEWRPFHYYAFELIPKPVKVIVQVFLEPKEQVTTLHQFVKLKSFLPSFINRPISKLFVDKAMHAEECLRDINRFIQKYRNESAPEMLVSN